MPLPRRLLMLVFCVAFMPVAKAQTQADNWYFGNNAAMKFKKFGGYHVGYPIFNGQLTSIEGCASISDTSGRLLFYTNGVNVWDSTHTLMPNGTGLFGSPNSTQSAIIVQKPQSSNIYYIITTAYHLSANGVRWTEVDMSLNGGKGDVTSNKNILLYASATEKLCGVKHCNKKDVWVITHDWNNNQFWTYLVTSSGISATPVISSSGSVHSGSNLNKIGQMKVSMDGKKIACAVTNAQFIELHDFDNITGVVSSGFILNNNLEDFYGVEFSKNASKLYASTQTSGKLYQWDLCAGTNIDVINSIFFFINDTLPNTGSLQLGPDGKIYRARNNHNFIDFIEYPNNSGFVAKYCKNAIALWPGMSSTYGLPGFIVDYINPAVKIWYNYIPPGCMIAQFFFSAPSGVNCSGAFNNILSFYWDFGDPASGVNNTSTLPNPVHAFSAPGGYTVSLILTYDCVIDTISIQVPAMNFCNPQGSSSTSNSYTIDLYFCPGDPAGAQLPFSNPNNLTPPFYVAWVPWIGTGFNPSAGGPGTYNAVVIDSNSIGEFYTINVIMVQVPTIDTIYIVKYCDSVQVCVIVNGGTPSCSTQPQGLVYTHTVGMSNCSTSVSIFVPTQHPKPTISLTTNDVLCYGGSDGSSDASATTGGTPAYSFSWSNGGNGPTQVGLLAGNYSVWVSDQNGCSDTTSFIINEPPPLIISTFPPIIQNPSCPGAADGYGEVFFSGGTPPYTYLWSNGTTTIAANNLTAGPHTVTITDANGCSYDTTIVLIDPPPIVLQTNSTPAACQGISDGTATVVANAGTAPYSYLWSNGVTTDINSGLAPGIYYVTITDSNGCTMTDSVTVSQLTSVIPSLDSSSDATCNGASDGSATISASGGTLPYSYLWSNGNTNNYDNNLSANNYTVTITDNNGCTSTINVIINEPPPYTVSIQNITDVSCFGGNDGNASVQISAGVQPINYLWSNGLTGSIQLNLSANIYTITATDAVGCSATTTVIINEPAQLIATFSASTGISCYGANDGSITALGSGGTIPYTYNWSNGLTGNVISGLLPGIYDVTITDNNNCTSSATITINEPALLTSSITNFTDVSCFGGNNGSATINASGGTSPYNYLWSGGGNNSTATGLSQGSYVATVTDANGCSSSSTVQISEPSQLIISLTAVSETCNNTNGSAIVNGSGGVVPYSYLWSNGLTSATISNIPAGNYNVTITDANGCTITGSIFLTNIPGPIINITSQQDASCFGYCDGSINLNVTSGTSPFNYAWSNLPGNNLSYAANLCTGNYDVTVTDSNNCTSTIMVIIQEPSQVITSLSPDAIICIGDSISLNASSIGGTPGYNYTWNPGNINLSSISVAPLVTTVYTVSTNDANGCLAANQNVTVTVIPLPNVTFTSDLIEGCEPLCVTFFNQTPDASICDWYFANQNHSEGCSLNYCFSNPGTYDVALHVTDIYGCSNNIIKENYIAVFPKPAADFTFNPPYATIFEPYIHFKDMSSGDVLQWLWKFGDPQESISLNQNPTFIYRDTGIYTVRLIVTNQYGCTDSVFKEVEVEELFTVFIPNAFTPDYINPVFKPVFALQDLENYNFKIMNRWGEIIYKTEFLHEGWDGYQHGMKSPEGVYIYLIEAEHRQHKIKKLGSVTLLR